MKDEEALREAILDILGLEVDMKDQVILKSYEDAMSDWAYNIEQLMALLKSTAAEAYRQGAIDELENQLDNFVGKKYYQDPVTNIKDRLAALQTQADSKEDV